MTDCLFCRIVAGTIRSKKVYENDEILAFHDANPQAPTHILVIPKPHIESLDAVRDGDAELLGRLLLAIRDLAAEAGIAAGYRLVSNCGAPAGQSVFHLHFHLLGGRPLGWPPG
ncbi:MAG TPA: histidine triad nucleotide-binding protein [Candidatus Polarisedimenticolaceae bacterium]|nr:histidine triad nucleotide-binding protein [Candidatus Polarisedimenticolaceae bacterium]